MKIERSKYINNSLGYKFAILYKIAHYAIGGNVRRLLFFPILMFYKLWCTLHGIHISSSTVIGDTHYTIEDLAVMRSIPNITIMSPADGASAVKQFELARKAEGAVYIRLTGNLNCPMVYKEETDFEIGKAIAEKEFNYLHQASLFFNAIMK